MITELLPSTGVARTLAASVEQDAAAEGLSRRWTWRIFWAPVIGGAVCIATLPRRSVFDHLVQEDGPFEWIQFALCVLTAVVTATVAVRFMRRGNTPAALVFALFALSMCALAGEEISWGQRVFAFDTPGSLQTLNHQQEFNVHDIDAVVPIEEMLKAVQMLVALGGVGLAVLNRLAPYRVTAPMARLLAPPLFMLPCFALAFAYRFARFFLVPEYDAVVGFQEWAEICLYFGLAVMAVCVSSGQSRRRPGRHCRHVGGGPALVEPHVILAAAAVAALTAVFAALTAVHGIPAGNAPEATPASRVLYVSLKTME
jgi:uncharacterized membrane protein